MKSAVYFIPVTSGEHSKLGEAAGRLLERVVGKVQIELQKHIPLKVHFGEKGNKTFIPQEAFLPVIEFLEKREIKSSYIETNVMYYGQRMKKSDHLQLASDHGFDRLPVIIADGDRGEDFYEVKINGKHFDSCKLGKEFEKYNQYIVAAHFKGHAMAGFGGALKQLAMGFASRGGKVAQHLDAKPFIIPFLCKKCGACAKKCPVDAITLGFIPKVNHSKCVGCAACMALCPQKAMTFNFLKIFSNITGKKFGEKVAEYAAAAAKGRKNIYINFASNITAGCDCEGRPMKPVIDDIGVFASTDPVAIDRACLDMAEKKGRKFKGEHILTHAEKTGAGRVDYDLIEEI